MNTYLFDFDGTLVDSMPTYVSVMLRILDENEVSYDRDIMKTITPLGYRGTAEYYKTLGVSLSVDEMVETMQRYALDEYVYNIKAKDSVVDVLKLMHQRGDRLNVLTASPHGALDPCLKRLGIYDLFDNVWSCEDFKTTKSDPKIYGMAAEKIGAPVEDIIFLDDNFNALMTAKAAGMRVYGVYDASSEEYSDEIRGISERYISNFKELI